MEDTPLTRQPALTITTSRGGTVQPTGKSGWRLEIPQGPKGAYRLAQVDDYARLQRSAFRWRPPVSLSLRARASYSQIPGTWGFGLWNDPFGMAIARSLDFVRLPTLPNCAWFFFASPPNALSLRDDLPACGALAATFRSPRLPAPLLALGIPALTFLLLPPAARLLRRMARRIVRQEARAMDLDPTGWHAYALDWRADQVAFRVDGELVLETATSPPGPLGLVLWVDNQYAALPASGRISFGSLANPDPAWVEIEDLKLDNPPGRG